MINSLRNFILNHLVEQLILIFLRSGTTGQIPEKLVASMTQVCTSYIEAKIIFNPALACHAQL